MSTVSEARTAPAAADADRLGKRPRRVTVGVYLDEDLAEEWERAVAEVNLVRERHLTDYTRRVAAAAAAARDEGRAEAEAHLAVFAELQAELEPLVRAAAEALAALDEGTLWLTFRSLGRRRFRELQAEHSPTEKDQQEWAASGRPGKALWAAETFGRALVREAAVTPALSAADVQEMATGDAWSDGDWRVVFETALSAQVSARPLAAALQKPRR